MAEEVSNSGNLDFNLHPEPELGPDPVRMVELSELFTTSATGAALLAGRGSIAGVGRVSEGLEKRENGSKLMRKESVTEEKKDAEKKVCSEDSFFDCSICWDLSKEPVLTKCGHLYCWACLYEWLQYSWAKECPTCKGDASETTLTPLIGRGKHRRDSEVSDPRIPPRPLPRCIRFKKSFWRGVPTPTEMISQFEMEYSSSRERRDRPFLNSFLTSRGLRAEPNLSTEALVTSTGSYQTSNIFPENEGANGIPRFTAERFMDPSWMTHGFGRNQLQNSALSNEIPRSLAERFTDPYWMTHGFGRNQVQNSALSNEIPRSLAERFRDPYWMTHGFGRNQVQNSTPTVGVAENDSEASTFGVINLESGVDTDEIESMLTVPASSSVGIHENGSRVPDVDSEDSRPLRRRRFT